MWRRGAQRNSQSQVGQGARIRMWGGAKRPEAVGEAGSRGCREGKGHGNRGYRRSTDSSRISGNVPCGCSGAGRPEEVWQEQAQDTVGCPGWPSGEQAAGPGGVTKWAAGEWPRRLKEAPLLRKVRGPRAREWGAGEHQTGQGGSGRAEEEGARSRGQNHAEEPPGIGVRGGGFEVLIPWR